MNSLEKFDLGRPSDGSTFSTTLHLLAPQLQEWIRRTADKKQLRRFAVACVRALLPQCPIVPSGALRAIEVAERFCAGQGSETQLEDAYAAMSPVVKEANERFRAVYQEVDAGRATLDDSLAAELAHRAATASRACVLRSASVAAAEAVFEHTNVLTRRKTHALQQNFLTRAEQTLDTTAPWTPQEQDELLQSYLKDLPRPFTSRLCKASDASLRLFACDCATAAVDFARQELSPLGQAANVEPLAAIIATSRRSAAGQATAAELKTAHDTGLKTAREWYRKEDELRDAGVTGAQQLQAATILAETADCVYPTAEASAKLAAVKCLRVAMHVLRAGDTTAAVYPLAQQFLGPPPPPN